MRAFKGSVLGSVVLAAVFSGAGMHMAVAEQGAWLVAPDSSIPAAQQLYSLANQSRAEAGVGPLKWDVGLAAAALRHCERMAAEGRISHQYPRARISSARASGGCSLQPDRRECRPWFTRRRYSPGWLDSPGHRANLLNPEVDSVGIAVIAGGGVFYAVADYSRAVPVLTREQVEATVAALLRASGLFIVRDPSDARAYCAKGSHPSGRSAFMMVWESPDISTLPRDLARRVASGVYRSADVGACAPESSESGFTSYRVAVVLY